MEEKTYEEMQKYVVNTLKTHGRKLLGLTKSRHLHDLGLRIIEHEPISEMEDIYYYIKYVENILKGKDHPSALIVHIVSQDLMDVLNNNPSQHRTYNYTELYAKAALAKATMG